MCSVADIEPRASGKRRAVVAQGCTDAVTCRRPPEFYPQGDNPAAGQAVKHVMRIPFRHRNTMRIEIEPGAIAGFVGRGIIRHIDAGVAVNASLHPIRLGQRRSGAHAQGPIIRNAGRPRRQVP